MSRTQAVIICIQFLALIVVFTFILWVIVTQASMYHDPSYLWIPTPNIKPAS